MEQSQKLSATSFIEGVTSLPPTVVKANKKLQLAILDAIHSYGLDLIRADLDIFQVKEYWEQLGTLRIVSTFNNLANDPERSEVVTTFWKLDFEAIRLLTQAKSEGLIKTDELD